MPKVREVTAVYPGTFDPLTNGHLDVIRRARKIFPRLIVAVGPNPAKDCLFSVKERVEMIVRSVRKVPSVEVTHFDGLVVDFLRKKRCRVILRGIRTFTDYEYEFQMALTNRSMAKQIETVFIMPGEEHSSISSQLVKEVASMGGDVSAFVPPPVLKRMRTMYPKKRRQR